MTAARKPLFLLADSSLLFWRRGDSPFVACLPVLLAAAPGGLHAAYLGASNGDEPAYFELFVGAMEGAGITRCRMIPSRPTGEDLAWLARADVILLAGGDPRLGWETFQGNGVEPLLRQRHAEGAILLGISAGAMQLAARAWSEPGSGDVSLFTPLALCPFLVGVHEPPEWPDLKRAVRAAGPGARGIGIPLGGGALLHPDGRLEPVRHPVVELVNAGGVLRESRLAPPALQSLVTK
jgi:hypothetical protein